MSVIDIHNEVVWWMRFLCTLDSFTYKWGCFLKGHIMTRLSANIKVLSAQTFVWELTTFYSVEFMRYI